MAHLRATLLALLFILTASVLIACSPEPFSYSRIGLDVSMSDSTIKVGETVTISGFVANAEIEHPQYFLKVSDNGKGFAQLVDWLGGEPQALPQASKVIEFVSYTATDYDYGAAFKLRGLSPGTAIFVMSVHSLLHDPSCYPTKCGASYFSLDSRQVTLTVTAP